MSITDYFKISRFLKTNCLIWAKFETIYIMTLESIYVKDIR